MLGTDSGAQKYIFHFLVYFFLLVSYSFDTCTDLSFQIVRNKANYDTTFCFVALVLNQQNYKYFQALRLFQVFDNYAVRLFDLFIRRRHFCQYL